MTVARNVIADLVLQRVMGAIDIDDLLAFEARLRTAIKLASDQGDAGLDAGALLDDAWARAGELWRNIRVAENEPLDDDDDECALCANPPPGQHFVMDLAHPEAGLRPVFPRDHRHRR